VDGSETSLAAYHGKVLLIVNVASKCGLTPQYGALQALYAKKHAKGLEVLGFPANNALDQEPGDDSEIMAFCASAYSVTFPLFSKISVCGEDVHPLYRALIAARPATVGEGPMRERLKQYGVSPEPPPAILWSFEKFLIGRDGQVVERFAPDMPVDDPLILDAIGAALAPATQA
jgi:glutathione peroxidase